MEDPTIIEPGEVVEKYESYLLAGINRDFMQAIYGQFDNPGPTGLINSGEMRIVVTYLEIRKNTFSTWVDNLLQPNWDSGGCLFSPHKVVLQ